MVQAPTSLTHWGAFSAAIDSGDIASVTPFDGDTDPSPLLGNLPGSIRHRSRIATPAVRRGWLRDGPGSSAQRGADEFVAVSWKELTELLAGELRRVVDSHGNKAIYGGSYGWASAGRFHHAQSQADPQAHRLSTPSGRIEIFSADIDGFGYGDCAGHPKWYEPSEWLRGPRATSYPLHLLANQPASRLHSQLDGGAVSQASKVQGREPIRIHPTDAATRGLADGDVVRVFNDHGACLAGVVIDDRLRHDVVQLPTGAWVDPPIPSDPNSMCVHGNPNVLTDDLGTSSLARGCTGAHVLVQVEKFTGPLPPPRATNRR